MAEESVEEGATSPMVKIPPEVVPVACERERRKVIWFGSEGFASKIWGLCVF